MIKCEAEIAFGDDQEDNEATFRCGRRKGHEGRHAETGTMGEGQAYRLTWHGDERVTKLQADISYLKKQADCPHTNTPLPTNGYSWCEDCGLQITPPLRRERLPQYLALKEAQLAKLVNPENKEGGE